MSDIQGHRLKDSGKRLELFHKGSKAISFVDPEDKGMMPKLYMMSVKRWNERGNPEVVYI